MANIKTQEDWWKSFDETFPKLKEWFDDLPKERLIKGYESLKPRSRVLEKLRETKTISAHPFLQELRNAKDHETLVIALNDIWYDAPDKPYIHQWNGWGDFCDCVLKHGCLKNKGKGAQRVARLKSREMKADG